VHKGEQGVERQNQISFKLQRQRYYDEIGE
jgi:hypothetical protein